MIGVNGQWLLQFNLEGRIDFVLPMQLRLFSITEEAGGKMPTFYLEFSSPIEELAAQLGEGANLRVLFGQTPETLTSAVLYIVESTNSRDGDGMRNFILQGFTVHPSYYANTHLTACAPMSGVERLRRLTDKYFKSEFNVDVSTDKQIWLQPNISDKRFAEELWVHSYRPDSWLGIGITVRDNTFRLLDMKKHLGTEPRWRFVSTIQDPNKDLVYEGDYTDRSCAGLVNTWVGYDKVHSWYNLENGAVEGFTPNTKPRLAMSTELNQRTDGMQPRLGQYHVLSGNMDRHRYIAYYQNLTNLALFSSYRLEFGFNRQYAPIQVLDLVLFKEQQLDDGRTKMSSEATSGLFIVSKVTRIFEARQALTRVEISREAPGNLTKARAA